MKYEVLSTLKFNGKKYEKGDVIAMEEDDAKDLVEGGVIVDPNKKEEVSEVDNSDPNKPKATVEVKMNKDRLPGEVGHEADPALDGKGKIDKKALDDSKKGEKKDGKK